MTGLEAGLHMLRDALCAHPTAVALVSLVIANNAVWAWWATRAPREEVLRQVPRIEP